MDIRYLEVLEQPLELRFGITIGNIALRNQSLTARIGVEGEAVGKQVDREARILWISLAVVLVDENWAGQRNVFGSVEWVVREQYPTVSPDDKASQALAAWAVTGGHLRVRGMPVAR
jgi:hypothetical protein